MVFFRYHEQCFKIHDETLELTRKHFGEISIEYIEFMFSYSSLNMQEGQLHLALSVALDTYEKSTQFYGTEKNQHNIDILLNLIKIKYMAKEYQQSMEYIEKAENIELEIGSANSYFYRKIQEMRRCVDIEMPALKNKEEPKGFIAKLMSNSPFKILTYTLGAITVITVGIYYYKKGRSLD